MASATTEALRKEAEGIKQVEKRFADAVSRSTEDLSAIGDFYQELDPSTISQDNDWRAIMNALYGLNSSANDYRKIGLIKYLQYLAARHEVVQALYALRQQPELVAQDLPHETKVFKETMLFDLTALAAAKEAEFSRLPKGESIDIALRANQSLTLLLAKHRFSIVRDDEFRFIDESGKDVALRRGKNIVGRDNTSDVVVDAEYRDVSRKHLIVETGGEEVIRLTDISSLGTSIPNEYLDATAP